MIAVENLEKIYRRGDGTPVMALKNVSFTIDAGEFVTVRGASGSGKSSLLNILGCLDTPTSGVYRLAGEDVSGYTDEQRSHLRCRRIGFVFQSFNLLSRTTALENVEVPALYSGQRIEEGKAAALLERVGLAERGGHFMTELSGGEQQRVAIARALMNDPPLLLADEPTGNLDSEAGHSIMELLGELSGEGRTIILVTHDEAVAAFAQRELLIRDGIIASDTLRTAKPPAAEKTDS
ncbi:MAG: ABC transporter ATP-binding protein [Gammaproteobacteria bacterium]|jgi:ABC-type lipoprotein export system ATPase subunit|nr:ABC transporter ATP-binding protein [Gammaproteobacteria bacterium]MDP7152822.1 ABC transporter ATP-binding protein [Gammaproteobacteria bacterium]MDP7297128.1 ABC transporter ATP-binding protein [Gammaproteobacteria bacterium]MDP7418829.1 ABC transporter ATP-binding protein [Gammaproteobacteria bacterium]HJP39296.1 ABC transporter ATP-binding protein [Gammaproteobacteria bacterium]